MARQNIVNATGDLQMSIPPAFRADAIAFNMHNSLASNGLLCLLHSASLQCLSLINQAHACDEKWVLNLRDPGRRFGAMQLPPGWKELIHQARSFMVLFGQT